jgi:hypothetical protein
MYCYDGQLDSQRKSLETIATELILAFVQSVLALLVVDLLVSVPVILYFIALFLPVLFALVLLNALIFVLGLPAFCPPVLFLFFLLDFLVLVPLVIRPFVLSVHADFSKACILNSSGIMQNYCSIYKIK